MEFVVRYSDIGAREDITKWYSGGKSEQIEFKLHV